MDSAQKRCRVTRACLNCQSLRRKCDGAQPCAQCDRRHIECTYSAEPAKKPGPKPGISLKSALAENERLRQELERLRASVQPASVAAPGAPETFGASDTSPQTASHRAPPSKRRRAEMSSESAAAGDATHRRHTSGRAGVRPAAVHEADSRSVSPSSAIAEALASLSERGSSCGYEDADEAAVGGEAHVDGYGTSGPLGPLAGMSSGLGVVSSSLPAADRSVVASSRLSDTVLRAAAAAVVPTRRRESSGAAHAAPVASSATLSASATLRAGGRSYLSTHAAASAASASSAASSSASASAAAGSAALTSASASASSLSLGADPRLAMWNPPGPIIPTPAEMALLQAYFSGANVITPAVDEPLFWAALEEARYYTGSPAGAGEGEGEGDGEGEGEPEVDADAEAEADPDGEAQALKPSPAAVAAAKTSSGSSSGASAGAGAGASASIRATRDQGAGIAIVLAPTSASSPAVRAAKSLLASRPVLQRNAEAFGLRVLFHTVLAVSSQWQGRSLQARHYYELARAFLAPCFSQPSQHVLSALLLMVTLCRSLCVDLEQAALHASLALRMAEMLQAGPQLLCLASFMSAGATALTEAPDWPAVPAPPDVPFYKRLSQVWTFFYGQLMSNFSRVGVAQVPAFCELMDETVALQMRYGIMPAYPFEIISTGVQALLYFRVGDAGKGHERARAFVLLALRKPLLRFCPATCMLLSALCKVLHPSASGKAAAAAAMAAGRRDAAAVAGAGGPAGGGAAAAASLSATSSDPPSDSADDATLAGAAREFVRKSPFPPLVMLNQVGLRPGIVAGDAGAVPAAAPAASNCGSNSSSSSSSSGKSGHGGASGAAATGFVQSTLAVASPAAATALSSAIAVNAAIPASGHSGGAGAAAIAVAIPAAPPSLAGTRSSSSDLAPGRNYLPVLSLGVDDVADEALPPPAPSSVRHPLTTVAEGAGSHATALHGSVSGVGVGTGSGSHPAAAATSGDPIARMARHFVARTSSAPTGAGMCLVAPASGAPSLKTSLSSGQTQFAGHVVASALPPPVDDFALMMARAFPVELPFSLTADGRHAGTNGTGHRRDYLAYDGESIGSGSMCL